MVPAVPAVVHAWLVPSALHPVQWITLNGRSAKAMLTHVPSRRRGIARLRTEAEHLPVCVQTAAPASNRVRPAMFIAIH